MVQIQAFPSGGYVVHRLPGYWKGRVSAWFNADGQLLNAKQFIGRGDVVRQVRRGSPMWHAVASCIHVKKAIDDQSS